MFDDFQPDLLYADLVACSSPKRRDELSQQCRAKVVGTQARAGSALGGCPIWRGEGLVA